MDKRELEGVIATRWRHIRNRDVRLMTLVAVLVGVIAMLADMLLRMLFYGGGRRAQRNTGDLIVLALGIVGLILAPIAAIGDPAGALAAARVPRRRGGAEITGDAEGLALALRKLAGRPAARSATEPRDGAPLHRGAAEQGERPTGAPRRPLQHAPVARGRASRGSRRPAASSSLRKAPPLRPSRAAVQRAGTRRSGRWRARRRRRRALAPVRRVGDELVPPLREDADDDRIFPRPRPAGRSRTR